MSNQHTDAYGCVWNISYDFPPIPIRSCDYSATREGDEEGDVVHGPDVDHVIAAIEEMAEDQAQDTREETKYRVRMAGKPMSVRDM